MYKRIITNYDKLQESVYGYEVQDTFRKFLEHLDKGKLRNIEIALPNGKIMVTKKLAIPQKFV